MMRVQIIRNIRIDARPSLERLKLRFRLAHITIKVIEISQILRFVSSVRVGRVVAFVMLDVDEDAVLFSGFEKELVMLEGFDGGFGD